MEKISFYSIDENKMPLLFEGKLVKNNVAKFEQVIRGSNQVFEVRKTLAELGTEGRVGSKLGGKKLTKKDFKKERELINQALKVNATALKKLQKV